MEVVDLTGDDDPILLLSNVESIELEVMGPPKALPRMRHFRNRFFNPAGGAMRRFRAAVLEQVPGLDSPVDIF